MKLENLNELDKLRNELDSLDNAINASGMEMKLNCLRYSARLLVQCSNISDSAKQGINKILEMEKEAIKTKIETL